MGSRPEDAGRNRDEGVIRIQNDLRRDVAGSNFKADLGGIAFHGRGLDGYDSTRRLYTSVWVDSMSGSPMILTGTKEGKVTTMTGEGPGPAGTAKYKTVSTMDSADKMTFKMSMGEGKEEMEMMTVTYTRKKK